MPGRPLTRQSRVILADLSNDPDWWDDVFDRVACGDRLKDIAAEYCVLEGQMSLWIESRAELASRYDVALKARGNLCAEDIIPIADGEVAMVDGTRSSEARDRLRIDARGNMAASWNRARYGKPTGVTVNAGAGSLIAILTAMDQVGAVEPPRDTAREPIDVTPGDDSQAPSLPSPIESAAPPDDTGCESDRPYPPTATAPPATASAAPAYRVDESLLV